VNTLSLCMIVKNEEATIERCLSSTQGICDEIVIADTGSTDATKEILKKFPTVKVVDFTWIDDFAAARNESFRHATSDLIFWMDADDILKEKDIEILKKYKSTPLDQLADCYVGKYQYSHDQYDNVLTTLMRERIFKRGSHIRWKYKIHECIPLNCFKSVQNTDFEVHHYKTKDQIKRAEGRNLRILEACVKDPAERCPRYEFYYAKELAIVGKYDEAVSWFQEYLKHWDFFEDAYYARYKLAEIALERRNYDEAVNQCMDALKLDMRKADLYCLLGLIFVNRERWDLAKFWYEAALNMPRPEDSYGFFDMDRHTYSPNFQLSFIFYKMGNFEAALKHIEVCLKYRPNDPQASVNKAFILAEIKKKVRRDKPSVAFYIPFKYDLNNPNIRIRKLNLMEELRKKGVDADVVQDFPSLMTYDRIIAHSPLNPKEMRLLQRAGKTVALDIAEGVFSDSFDNQIMKYDLVFCSSSKIKEHCLGLNMNSIHLPDTHEVKR
jgi:glycosyltransferase involved in cell wall biosynthesis